MTAYGSETGERRVCYATVDSHRGRIYHDLIDEDDILVVEDGILWFTGEVKPNVLKGLERALASAYLRKKSTATLHAIDRIVGLLELGQEEDGAHGNA